MKPCRQARRAIRRRLDERLAIEAEFELDAHLERCADCRAGQARALRLEEALAKLPEPATERLDLEHSVRTIRARVEGETEPPRLATRRLPIGRLAAAAAAALLVGLFLFELLTRDDPGASSSPEKIAGTAPVEPAEVVLPPEIPTDDSPLDRDRLEATREEVRGLLAATAAELPEGADTEAAVAFAEAFDLRAAPLRHREWPVLRIVEGLLEKDDATVARAAARYLGVRGDSRSTRQLTRALERPGLAAACTLALRDLGEAGLGGLRVALEHREVRGLALDGILRVGGEPAAATLAAALSAELETGEGQLTPSEDLFGALTELGEAAVGPLLAIGERGWLPREELFSTLEGLEGIEAFCGRELEAPRRGEPDELLLACAVRFAPDVALSWCTRNLLDRRNGELAIEHLPRIAGERTVAALIDLRGGSRLGSAELERMTARALSLDRERFATKAEQLRGSDAVGAASDLAELLITANAPGAGAALGVLATLPSLEPALRQAVVLAIGEVGEESDLPALLELFATLGVDDRHLAATCLISIAALGGEDASRLALEGVAARPTQNVLSLLHRRKTGEGKNPSIYKLARELKPILADRALDHRSTSS